MRALKYAVVAFLITSVGFSATKSRFEKLELFNKVLILVESQYYRDVDTEKLIQGAIKGMMSTLDPHSAFLDQEVFKKMREDTQGEFGGLGIEVTQKDGMLIVITPIDDTPADKAGIKAGDKIVEINHESTVGITLEEAVEMMRGKPGSKVNVGIVREGVEGIKNIVVERKVIRLKPVKSALVDKNYMYIRLTQFQKRSASSIIESMKKLKKEAKKNGGAKGLVLDLRNNPGGLLDEAVKVSSIFLKDGVVVSTEGRDPKQKEIRYVLKGGYKDLKIPIVVLINGASASASEIVAGALQDHKRSIIMGTQSFGKGSVQTIAKIDDTQGVKLTIAQYMTPKDRKIQAVGIKPDVVISEYEGAFHKEKEKENRYIRERDLKNHLTATIETPEEKKLRIAREKKERKERIARLKELRSNKKKKKEEVVKKTPDSDFQVIQAIKHLKSFELARKILNG